jgi:hypothetical protein
MSSRVRLRVMAPGLVVFVASAGLRPATAAAASDDDDDRPTAAAPAPAAAPAVTPYPQGAAAPPPPYPVTPYAGYPPPGYAPYPPYPGYPPPQLTKVRRARRGLVTAGAVTFGVSWGIAASVSFILLSGSSCSGSCDEADVLWIPVAGPLLVAAQDNTSDAPGPFILWSLAQAAGLTMFIIGLVGRDVMEYRVAERGPTFRLAPLLARDANGLALTARW